MKAIAFAAVATMAFGIKIASQSDGSFDISFLDIYAPGPMPTLSKWKIAS